MSFPPLIPAGPPGRHVMSPALGRWMRRAWGLARWLRPPPTAPSPPPPLPSTPLIIFNKVPPPPVPPAIRRAWLVLDRHGGPLLAVLLALVVAVIVHAVDGGLRLRPGDIRVTAGPVRPAAPGAGPVPRGQRGAFSRGRQVWRVAGGAPVSLTLTLPGPEQVQASFQADLAAVATGPVLRSVLAGYDGKVGFAATTRAALADLAAGPWSRP